MASGEGSRKRRKHNFSASQVSILTEKVEENLAILQSKFTNSVTNWKMLLEWTSPLRQRSAKDGKIFIPLQKFRKETKKTGGGPAPKEISTTT